MDQLTSFCIVQAWDYFSCAVTVGGLEEISPTEGFDVVVSGQRGMVPHLQDTDRQAGEQVRVQWRVQEPRIRSQSDRRHESILEDAYQGACAEAQHVG